MLLTRKWLLRHALLLLALGIFLALGYWQLLRAGEGNARSVGYAFEWPLLALCAIYAWVRALRHDLRPPAPEEPISTTRHRPASATTAQHVDDESDEELAAYNRYLAELHEHDLRQRR